MLIEDKLIKVRIHNTNRKYYEEIFNKELKINDWVTVKQKDIQKASRNIVECICDYCGKKCNKQMYMVKKNTFCDIKCRNNYMKEHNPNPPKEKIMVNCHVCGKEFMVQESKYKSQKYFLCSRECYKTHRSKLYKSTNLYNYQDIKVSCASCNKEFKTIQFDLETREHLFCSQECYWKFRRKHYIEFYYAPSLNNSRKETLPEKMVREWLDKNNIVYIQEFEFLNKYYIDFYLPEYKCCIEVYGDYWHVNPNIYSETDDLKPLTNQQVGVREYDEYRNKEIESYGYKVFIIWESEIHEDIDFYMGKINECINKNPQRLHA